VNDDLLADRLLARGLVDSALLTRARSEAARERVPLARVLEASGLLDPGLLAEVLRDLEAGASSSSPPPTRRDSPSGRSSEQGLDLSRRHPLMVRRLLGRGGMGAVYLVLDPLLRRAAALKVVQKRHSDLQAKRFRREAMLTARLDHPGIPPVYETGRTDAGEAYLLMRYLPGRPLSEHVAEAHANGLPSAEALRPLLAHLVRVCEAVAYAHSRGIVHRDLKPDNVVLGGFGEVCVVDWGLARDLSQGSDEDAAVRQELAAGVAGGPARPDQGLTRDGALLGTVGYMAPEQVRCEDVDPRADVFSLGAILSQVLTAELPFDGDTALEILSRADQGLVTTPGARRSDLGPALAAVAAKALAPDREARYPSAQALGDDLDAWLTGRPVSTYRESALASAARVARQNPGALAGAGAIVLTCLFTLAAALETQARSAAAARLALVQEARSEALSAAESLAAAASQESGGLTAQRERTALAVAGLTRAKRWHALQPDDPQAGRRHLEAALALADLARTSRQWRLAEETLDAAADLGMDPAEVESVRARVAEERTAEARRRWSETERALAEALAGDLDPRIAEPMILASLVRNASPETLGLLCERLDQISGRLGEAATTALVGVAEPDVHERNAGQGELLGLRPALEQRFLRGEIPTPVEERCIRDAWTRFARRQARKRSYHRLDTPTVGALQRSWTGDGALAQARLVATALGIIGRQDPRTAPALQRYLLAEADPQRRRAAALALKRIDRQRHARVIATLAEPSDFNQRAGPR
jgi:serine/threonine protein kinase